MTDRETAKAMSQEIVIVNVHGTGDTERDEHSPKWWEPNSEFSSGLSRMLQMSRFAPRVSAFNWSGANSDRARIKAGKQLAAFLRQTAQSRKNIHIIAHSHGGNVVEEALVKMRSRRDREAAECIKSVTSIGTPFFRKSVGAFRLLVMAVLAISVIAILWYAWSFAYLYLSNPMVEGVSVRPLLRLDLVVSGVFFGFCALAILSFSLAPAWSHFFRKRSTLTVRWNALWHPQDEAIVLLKSMAEAGPRFLPRGSVRRVFTRTAEALAGLALLAGVIQAFWQARDLGIAESSRYLQMSGNIMLAAFTTFVIYSIVTVLGWWIELTGRWHLDESVFGAIRSGAMGQDGPLTISEVSCRPITFWALGDVMPAKDAEELVDNAKAAIIQLVQNNHNNLFSVSGANSLIGTFGRLDTSGVWDALVHTRYFESDYVKSYCLEAIYESLISEGLIR